MELTSQSHHVHNLKIYGASPPDIIIIGKRAFLDPLPSLKDSARFLPVLTSLDSAK
jgi:hypothetical protein